jgi:hypothetical protein
MAEKLGEAVLELTVDGKQYKYSLNKIENDTRKTFKLLDGIILGLGASLIKLGKQGFQKLIQFTEESIEVAQAAQETYSKFNVVFEDAGSAADEMAQKFEDDFDLASSTAQKLLSDTGDLLTGFGVAASEAINLSDATNRLAVDLASFSNAAGGAEAVSHALVSAYSGEREALKTYGIVINDAMVQAEMLKQAQEGLTFESEQQAKIYATLALAQEQSKNALGDYARTADSAANVQRRLQETSKDLQESIGNFLLPTVTNFRQGLIKVAGALRDVITEYNNLREAGKAVEEGTASTEQQIAVLKKEREELEAIETQYNTNGLVSKQNSDLILERRQAQIEAINAQIRVLEAEQARAEAMNQQGREYAAEQERLAKEEADRAKALADYLAKVAEAYAETEEGKIEALQAEINKWEEYEKTAVNTLPQVQAYLKLLREEMKGLTEDTDAVNDVTEELLESWSSGDAINSYKIGLAKLQNLYSQGDIGLEEYLEATDLFKEGKILISDYVAALEEDDEAARQEEQDLLREQRAFYNQFGTSVSLLGNYLIDLSQAETDEDEQAAVTAALSGLAGAAIDALMSIDSVSLALDPLKVILNAMVSVLEPVFDEVLAPLIGIFTTLGELLGTILIPVIQLLVPVIQLVAEIFVWLYNNVLLPIGQGLYTVFATITNALIWIINGVIAAINWALGWAGVHIATVAAVSTSLTSLGEISLSDLTAAGESTISDSSSSSKSASYSQVRPIENYFYIEDNNFNGTGGLREFMLMLYDEWEEANSMGLV